MAETLSIPIDSATMERLHALARSSNRSTSSLAAEAITSFLEIEEWQLNEVRAAQDELDSSEEGVDHDKVAKWLKSWGGLNESEAPE
jgi:predicted transcriptional regulator